jgi:tripartite-type tricarboxylate transporter receptor subunit TctC
VKEDKMKKRIVFFRRHILLLMMAVVLVFAMATGAAADVSFKGKVVVLVVPWSPGGGTDITARLMAKYLPNFIPGNPRIVVRNMPAGSALVGENYVWSAKPNGLTWLVASGGDAMNNIIRPKGAVARQEEMQPLYASSGGTLYYSRADLLPKPVDIMKKKGLVYSGMGVTSSVSGFFLWARELLDFECKMVLGYSGSAPCRLAFLSGETNITGESTLGYINAMGSYVKKGEVVPVFQSGILDDDGNVIRESVVPDVPTLKELYEQAYGKSPSGLTWEVCRLFTATRAFGKYAALPKDTPAEIVDTLRKSVEAMVKDPGFLKDAERINPGAPHIIGKSLVRNYPSAVQGSPETVQYMKKFFKEKYDVAF